MKSKVVEQLLPIYIYIYNMNGSESIFCAKKWMHMSHKIAKPNTSMEHFFGGTIC